MRWMHFFFKVVVLNTFNWFDYDLKPLNYLGYKGEERGMKGKEKKGGWD